MSTILNVNSSKKYDAWIGENTDFFSNLENDYDVTVDAGTQDLIELFFGNRYICDDDNFDRFFKRTLINTWDRYVDLLRIEKTQIDPLVADYFENQLVHTGEMTGSKQGTTSGMTEYGKTDTLTHNTTVTEDNSIATDETDTRTLNLANNNTRTDNLANSNTRTDNLTTTTDSKQAGANAVNPQSIEYSGTTAGSLPSLDWQYMSNQEQSEGEGTEHQTGTVTNQGTNTGTVQTAGTNTGTDTNVKDKDVSEDKSKRTTGTDAHALSGKDETSGNSTEATSGTDSHTDRERHTGRTGILPQEALRKAKAYIQKSRAFDWLKDELEPCFISIYDI